MAVDFLVGGSVKKMACGQHTTVDADDTVATGLRTVEQVMATLNDAPVAGCQSATGHISATAGAIDLKTWKATATADTAVVAASTFGKLVSWIAIGT